MCAVCLMDDRDKKWGSREIFYGKRCGRYTKSGREGRSKHAAHDVAQCRSSVAERG